MKRVAVLLGFFFAVCGVATAEELACETNPEIVAECFTVRGRLSFWNGAPTARIWPLGTKRMMGVHHDELPGEIRSLMATFDTELWGDFKVCPFTPKQAGLMQFVCIEAWRNITVRERSQ